MRDIFDGLRSFWADPAGRAVLGLAGTVIGTGTVFFRFVEGLAWLDSLYFCVITLTTVGFGDISPTTAAGKIFTMLYVVVGIGIFVALGSTVAHHLMSAKQRPTDSVSECD